MSGKPDVELGKASIDTANGYVSRKAEQHEAQTQKPVQETHTETPEYDSTDSDDESLPITANRHARWWYSIFHNITAMIGAGVLGLPYAFKYLGTSAVMHTVHDKIFELAHAHYIMLYRMDRGYHNTLCIFCHLSDNPVAVMQHA